MTKVCTVVGARPQFIKVAPVSRALQAAGVFEEVIIHTGQHYDESMSQIFFDELGIAKPSYNLQIGSASHGAQTGRMLEAIETVLLTESPDWVLVYGDTNSTLAAALAASKLNILVAHVEAGLRSFNKRMAEEINRIATDHVSDLLFAPTEAAVSNLTREGIPVGRISQVGDVMFDSARMFTGYTPGRPSLVSRMGLQPKHFILATVHRAENTESLTRLQMIFTGLNELSNSIPVIMPLHPRTRLKLHQENIRCAGITICDPVGYLDMGELIQNSSLVCTDSGGLQKEAYFHEVPCLTLRPETEWVELVALGCNRLLTSEAPGALVSQARSALAEGFPHRAREAKPYGNGRAANEIVSVLVNKDLDRISGAH